MFVPPLAQAQMPPGAATDVSGAAGELRGLAPLAVKRDVAFPVAAFLLRTGGAMTFVFPDQPDSCARSSAFRIVVGRSAFGRAEADAAGTALPSGTSRPAIE
eukprot:6176987-Pleurochrysis_carterae.AAC.6